MSGEVPLNQLQPNMNSFATTVIVLDPGAHRRTQNGSILTMKVADATGSINASIMNPEFTETFKPGDILKFRGAYTSIFQGGLTIGVGKNGECKKMGEFVMVFSETPDISQMPLPAGVTDRRSDDRPPRQSAGGNRFQRV
uniref:OB domain-containing protein n=1 Tax=Caenorhabditis tropicalis TaxID=1561998 RepID=A0A1I7V4P2_9PELO